MNYLIVFIYLIASVISIQVHTDAHINELTACLGNETSLYSIQLNGNLLDIERIDSRYILYRHSDAKLLECLQDHFPRRNLVVGPLSESSEDLMDLISAATSNSSNVPHFKRGDGTNTHSVVGHKEKNCPDEEYYAKEYKGMPTKCKTPKIKPYSKSLWLHNRLYDNIDMKMWPHHACKKGGSYYAYLVQDENGCYNRNTYSYKMKTIRGNWY